MIGDLHPHPKKLFIVNTEVLSVQRFIYEKLSCFSYKTPSVSNNWFKNTSKNSLA